MADTTFVDYAVPAVNADWLNDVNNLVYGSGVVSSYNYGAVIDNATDNTAAVQAAINDLPPYGGTVINPEGSKFSLTSLTFPARVCLKYRADDDSSQSSQMAPSIASGEQVSFHSTSSYPAEPSGGIVNEWRFTAPFHPGIVIDVRKDIDAVSSYLGAGQSLTNPVRASINFADERTGVGRTFYENYPIYSTFSGIYSHTWYNTCVLNGVGTAAWVSVPTANTLITGATSGATGLLVAVAAGSTTVVWLSGEFQVGEALTDNNETSSATITTITNAATSNQWLAQDFVQGNWSIGLPPGVTTHTFAVGGKIAATITRTAGQHIPTAVANPAFVLVDNYEAGTTYGFEITYNTTPAAASRRLTLRNLNSSTDRANIGAAFAHGAFSDAGAVTTSAYNIASITKNGTGDYTVNFTNSAARADYSVSLTTQDPMQYAYVFSLAVGSVRVKVVTTGTSTAVNISGNLHINILGGDI